MDLDREELLEYARSRLWLWVGALVVLALLYQSWSLRAVTQPAGVLAPDEPSQGPPDTQAPWDFKGHRFFDLATFELRARVLGRERYWMDGGATLCPLDLALGWGPMSDSAVLKGIRISQTSRFYLWSTADPSIPLGEISTHSANMHIIPATGRERSRLLDLRPGQIVHIRGHLVRIEGPGGFQWTSSLTRQDTGDGACEVVWADLVEPLP